MSEEIELISRADGKRLAEEWAKRSKSLNIPDTLLSSQHIIDVVKATGLISPFFVGGGRYERLKKASYEGRVGSKAYRFESSNEPKLIFDSSVDEYLNVPKNSIVFVESDLDFRLPDFIALRFNLQIQHVHRGLLLGTGPLVDPGFWGKLCIPLHNLTDEDYRIPKSQGLFWVEFTKTTLPVGGRDAARVPLGKGSLDERGHWQIEEFLRKAANQYGGPKIPIRSSLPTMFEAAERAILEAANDAKRAKEAAEKFTSYNVIGVLAAVIALAGLIATAANFLSTVSARDEQIAGGLDARVSESQGLLERHILDVDRYGAQNQENRAALPSIRGDVDRTSREIAELRIALARQGHQIDSMKKGPVKSNCVFLMGQGFCVGVVSAE